MFLLSLPSARLICAAFAVLPLSWLGWLVIEDFMVKRKYRFPPVVPGLPLVGNLLQMPKVDQGPYLKQIGDKYGEM